MHKRYKREFITRRCAIQAIYKNVCRFDPDFLEKIKMNEEFLQYKDLDSEFFMEILNNIIENWESFNRYIKNNKNTQDEEFLLNRCAVGILLCAFSELSQKKLSCKIIINEYLEYAKMFCDTDVKILNKILDNFKNEILDN